MLHVYRNQKNHTLYLFERYEAYAPSREFQATVNVAKVTGGGDRRKAQPCLWHTL